MPNEKLHTLLESKKFNRAQILFDSKNFETLFDEKQKLNGLWYFYYQQGNYIKAQECLNSSSIKDLHISMIYTFAQLGDKKAIDSMFNKSPINFWQKAFVFAILKEKDSMYCYLNKMNGFFEMKGVNSRFEFDPYRKEKRFKALLKKNYLPITHWNE